MSTDIWPHGQHQIPNPPVAYADAHADTFARTRELATRRCRLRGGFAPTFTAGIAEYTPRCARSPAAGNPGFAPTRSR